MAIWSENYFLVLVPAIIYVHCMIIIVLFISLQIYVPTNPPGAETLPPGIIVPQTDLYLRRLWGVPSEV